MNLKSAASTAVTVLLVVIAGLILLTQIFGFPSPISFVATDSMEPQMEPGDGFIGVPQPLAGEIEPGDVITYEARTIGGGGLTTHRVVEITDEGYITKGDANPFRDTEAGEPPVKESQIQLVVVQINENVVTIPYIGQLQDTAQGTIATLINTLGIAGVSASNPGVIISVVGFFLVVVVGGYDLFTSDNKRILNRSVRRTAMIDSRLLLIGLLLILSLPLLSVSAIPSGTDEVTIISSVAPDPEDPSIIRSGSYTESNVTIKNNQPVPMVIIVEPASDGIEVYDQVLPASSGETVVSKFRVYAPEERGPFVRSRSTHYYIHSLPTSVIEILHRVHPIIALGGTIGIILLPVAIGFMILIGNRQIPLRDISR
jgi:signal peptidase